MLSSTPCRLMYPDDVSQSSYGCPAGLYVEGTLPALISTESLRGQRTLNLGAVNGPRGRGCIIRPLVDDGVVDNATINVRVLTIRPVAKHSKSTHSGWLVEHIGDLVCTAGSGTAAKGVYGTDDSGSYRVIDTLAFTPTALGTALFTAYDPAPSVYSPEDDTQGMLIMPDLGGAYGVILDPIDSSAFNGLVETIS